jgi:hypothetical protein
VKLLDFGLARPTVHEQVTGAPDLTRAGAVMGTPRYMSPEQALAKRSTAAPISSRPARSCSRCSPAGPRSTGNTVVAILHATVYEQPPALSGSPAVASVDRVIRRALAKKASERPATAEAMADELARRPDGRRRHRDDDASDDTDRRVAVSRASRRSRNRFSCLQPAGCDHDVARGHRLAGRALERHGGAVCQRERPTSRRWPREAGVDRVVSGTILRAGDELRTHVQLIEAPAAPSSLHIRCRRRWAISFSSRTTSRVASSRRWRCRWAARPRRRRRMRRRAPAPTSCICAATRSAAADSGAVQARDLYERSVALDPNYAPAWVALGRSYRLIGKYIEVVAGQRRTGQKAYDRALELNPKLTIAHKFYANLESDTGQASSAVVRLLNEATRHGNDPELFAGLVHACRYAGLYEESLARTPKRAGSIRTSRPVSNRRS